MNDKTLPEKIIVYRDGVGAGDIARLKDTEVAALKVLIVFVKVEYLLNDYLFCLSRRLVQMLVLEQTILALVCTHHLLRSSS